MAEHGGQVGFRDGGLSLRIPAGRVRLLALVSILLLVGSLLWAGLRELPPIDRDEPRFAQASRQMMESGDYVVPMVGDRPRLNKPPLVYWLQAGSARLLSGGEPQRDAIWMYRLPSAVACLGTVLLTWGLARSIFRSLGWDEPSMEGAAWLAAILLGVSPLVVVEAHTARADQLLLFTVIASQCCLWGLFRSKQAREWLWFAGLWLCVGIGILAKGPITPLIVLLTLVAWCWWDRSWDLMRRARPWFGLPLAMACILPWVVAVAHRVGWERYFGIVFDETLGRSVGPKEGHWGPPGYHLVLLVVLFLPGAALTGKTVLRLWRRGDGVPGLARSGAAVTGIRWSGKVRGWLTPAVSTPAARFLLAWLVPSWIVFELIGTKLPHYVMPLYPAVAIVSVLGLIGAKSRAEEWLNRDRGAVVGLWFWWGVGVAVTVGVPAFALWLISREDVHRWREPRAMMMLGLTVVAAGVLVVGAAKSLWGRDVVRASVRMGIAMLIALFGLFHALPNVGRIWLGPSVASAVLDAQSAMNSRGTTLLTDFDEDSVVFLLRGRTMRVDLASITNDPERELRVLAEATAGTVGVDTVVMLESTFGELQKVGGSGFGWRQVAVVEGFNYSRGRTQRVIVAARESKRE